MDHRPPMTFEVIVTTFLAGRGLAVDAVPTTTGQDEQVAPDITDGGLHDFVRPVAAALSVVCLAAAIAIAFAGDALAQANQAPPNQTAPAPQAAPPQQPKPIKRMALTDKQIEGVLAAQKDMQEITAKLVDNARPDPRITAQLDDVARKNGFASYDETHQRRRQDVQSPSSEDLTRPSRLISFD